MFEMLVGRSPFDIGEHDQPDQNTEDYLFQGEPACMSELLFNVVLCFDDISLSFRRGLCTCTPVLLDRYMVFSCSDILEKTIRIPRSGRHSPQGVTKQGITFTVL